MPLSDFRSILEKAKPSEEVDKEFQAALAEPTRPKALAWFIGGHYREWKVVYDNEKRLKNRLTIITLGGGYYPRPIWKRILKGNSHDCIR